MITFRHILPIVICTLLLFSLSAQSVRAEEKSDLAEQTLKAQLEALAEKSKGMISAEKRKTMESALQELRISKITESALKKGQSLPLFTLPDAKSKSVSAKELLAKGPLVVVFYRGGWCPYCNIHLRELQKHLDQIKSLGATLVAISPQTPDSTLSTVEKSKLEYTVLSDVGNSVAKKFGIVFSLSEDLKSVYKEFGIDLAKSNGVNEWELPLSATYVVKKDGIIAYSFLDVDYKKRADTAEILKILKEL